MKNCPQCEASLANEVGKCSGCGAVQHDLAATKARIRDQPSDSSEFVVSGVSIAVLGFIVLALADGRGGTLIGVAILSVGLLLASVWTTALGARAALRRWDHERSNGT